MICCRTYKFLNGVGKIDYGDKLEKINREAAITRMAAGHDNLKTKPARTDIRKNSFFVRVIQRWNGLPDEIKKSKNAEEFKKKLHAYKTRQVGGRQQIN
jgi:hypothetical protein